MAARAHEQDGDHAHEHALQRAQAVHALQQRRRAPEERVLARLLHRRVHLARGAPRARAAAPGRQVIWAVSQTSRCARLPA